MNHNETNKAIFEAYRPNGLQQLVERTSESSVQYVTISAIQNNLSIALNEMLKPLYVLIRQTANVKPSPRRVAALIQEITDGDASLVVPLLKYTDARPTRLAARELVVQHASMVLPDNVLRWLENAPTDAVLIVRDDLANERDIVSIPVTDIDV